MFEIPEYVCCVLMGLCEKPDQTWCGKLKSRFCFVDATHAILNGYKNGRLLICPNCSAEMFKALQQGTYLE